VQLYKLMFEFFLLTIAYQLYLFGFPEKWKHKKCTLDEVYKGAVIFLEAAIMEPATQVAGAQVVFDMDGLSLQQTWQFSPPFAKRIVDWLQVQIMTSKLRASFPNAHTLHFRVVHRIQI